LRKTNYPPQNFDKEALKGFLGARQLDTA